MTTSGQGRELIEQFEGLRLIAYKDYRSIPTIGYGHAIGVEMGDTITQEQADAFLADDLKTAEAAVNRLVTVPLTQNQFDAMVSFTYNTGQGNFAHSTLLNLLNQGAYAGAAQQFMKWVYTNGVVNPGLERRRAAEQKLFQEA